MQKSLFLKGLLWLGILIATNAMAVQNSCTDCHTSLKAQGKGINGGQYFANRK